MVVKRHLDRMRTLFLEQFEADGGDCRFRENMKGPPIRVTATERDAFASDFVRRVRYIAWAVTVAVVLLCVAPVLIAPDSAKDTQEIVIEIGVGGILTLCLAAGYRAWTAPARALQRRPLPGSPRSKADMRRRAFARITYGQLALCLPVAALLVISKGVDSWWTFVAGGLVVAALVQAVRKWRSERGRDR